MERESAKRLITTRWIVTMMYVGPLVVFQFVGRAVRPSPSLDPQTLGVLAAVLAVVGLTDYGLSLFLERWFLGRSRAGGSAAPVVTSAFIVSALGASLAVYGIVLTLLGAPGWGAMFYVACALHGFHLMVRWPRYGRAARDTPY